MKEKLRNFVRNAVLTAEAAVEAKPRAALCAIAALFVLAVIALAA